VAGNQRTSARLQLLRVMGLRLDTELALTDKLAYVPVDAVTMEQARAQALKERPDLKAQQEREANARMSASATKMERLPTVAAFGDYGSIGTGFDNALPTRTYGVSLRVPVFDGGRRDARRAESASQYRSEKVRTTTSRSRSSLDVRLALDGLDSAEQQVKVAKEGLDLSENELAQARRRVDAEWPSAWKSPTRRRGWNARADNQTAALYNYNVARIDLAQSMVKSGAWCSDEEANHTDSHSAGGGGVVAVAAVYVFRGWGATKAAASWSPETLS